MQRTLPVIRKLLEYSDRAYGLSLKPSFVRFLSNTDKPPGFPEDFNLWNNPLEKAPFERKGTEIMNQELEDFFEQRLKEEGEEGTRLFNSESKSDSSVFPNSEEIQKALSALADQLKTPEAEKSEDSKSTMEFTSKFGSFRSSFMQELTDAGLDDVTDTVISEGQEQQSTIQDFVNGFGGLNSDSLVESFFVPDTKRESVKKTFSTDTDNLVRDTSFKQTSLELPPVPKGGFRISIYRNVTGSIKLVLQSIRNEVLPSFIEKTYKEQTGNNSAFLAKLIDSLKYSEYVPTITILPQMTNICLILLERLPYLAADELALVCFVFGRLGYVNSLVFHRLFIQLQKPEILQAMSNEGLFGSVLSLGTLQSTEPEFLTNVKIEFERRFSGSSNAVIPADSLGSLLFGCCRSKDPVQATALTQSVLDVLCKEEYLLNPESVSWKDLALALYVCYEMKIWKPKLIKGLHRRLLKTQHQWNLKCMEAAALLHGLEGNRPVSFAYDIVLAWDEAYDLLEDCIEDLITAGKLDLPCIPDIVKSMSMPSHQRLGNYEALGKLIVDSETAFEAVPLWSIAFRLMSGYANTRYRDPEVLKVVNKRLMGTRMAALSARTVIQLLHCGYSLRGLGESLVDRIVELLSSASYWKKIVRPKDAAKAVYALAGFQKLTPQILQHCWDKCAEMKLSDDDSLSVDDRLEMYFTAQGLFAGYQYVSTAYSQEIADQHVPAKTKGAVLALIRKKQLCDSGLESKLHRDVAETLESMGISLSCPALILDGLYSCDIALHHEKVIVLVLTSQCYYSNSPDELTGRALLHIRQLEALGIKVISIQDCQWQQIKEKEKPDFLEKKFSEQGLKIKEIVKSQSEIIASKAPVAEDVDKELDTWIRNRTMVLKSMKLTELRELLAARQFSLKPEPNEAIQKITESFVVKNSLLPPSKAKKKLMSKPSNKGDVIRLILALETEGLFGSIVEKSGNISEQQEMTA